MVGLEVGDDLVNIGVVGDDVACYGVRFVVMRSRSHRREWRVGIGRGCHQ